MEIKWAECKRVLFHADILNSQVTVLCIVHLTWDFIVANGVKNLMDRMERIKVFN